MRWPSLGPRPLGSSGCLRLHGSSRAVGTVLRSYHDATAAAASAAKITATMQGLASSLQTLHQEAAAMVEEDAHVAKRPRTERTGPKIEDLEMQPEAKDGNTPFG